MEHNDSMLANSALVSSGQLSNALSPIEVIDSGIVTEVSQVQPLNASSPIEVTVLGIVIEDRYGRL